MAKQEFLELFWKSVDLFYDNNHKEGIGVRELLEIIFKYQKRLRGNEIAFKNLSPYEFQLASTFREIAWNEDEFQVVINWDRRKKVEYKFSISRLNILVDEKGVTFQDMKKQYHRKEITVLFA